MNIAGTLLRSKSVVIVSSIAVAFGVIMALMTYLPLSIFAPGDQRAQATQAPTPGNINKTVAYVENNPSMITAVKLALKVYIPDSVVRIYLSGELLLADVTVQPAVVILDGQLSNTYGWNYIPAIRARWPGVKIIGYSSMDVAQSFKDADGFVAKDAPPEVLMDLIISFFK